MLVEVDDLRVLIIAFSAFGTDDGTHWHRLCEQFACFFVADAAEIEEWRAVLPATASVLAWNRAVYNPVASAIREALDATDMQPHHAVYLTGNSDDLSEAISTRVGTLQVGSTLLDVLPDGWYPSLAHAIDALLSIDSGIVSGWIGEATTTCLGSGGRSSGFMARCQIARDVSDLDAVWFLGRYFATTDERHRKHQFSARLLKAKSDEASRRALAYSLAAVLPKLNEYHRFDVIAHVAPRPSAGSDHIGETLRIAAELADKQEGTSLRAIVGDTVVLCVRDYSEQKFAGSAEKRRENVRGAFRASDNVRGKSILLVDDILTTGATLAEAARALKVAGTESVHGLVLARTQNYTTLNPYLASCGRRCEGCYVLRFNSRDGSAFWGCSNYPDCKETVSWTEGILRFNALALREHIMPLYDVPF